MPEQQKRQTAYKTRIKHLLNGQYIKEEGWLPNYVIVGNRKISRINLMGTIISNTNGEAVIDDGSGNILMRSFEANQELMNLEVGSTVVVVGRIREYASQKYVLPEIIKRMDNEWLALRELELQKEELLNPVNETDIKLEQTATQTAQEEVMEEGIGEATGNREEKMVYEIIKNLDAGEGAAIEEVIKKTNNAEETINRLLRKGDIFEIKPGRLKVLE